MTNKIGVIFVNPQVSRLNTASKEDQKRKQIKKGKTAEKVFKELLGFEEVIKFTGFSKAQMIE